MSSAQMRFVAGASILREGLGSRPPDLGLGVVRGSWTDREILFHLIMYSKYIRKCMVTFEDKIEKFA